MAAVAEKTNITKDSYYDLGLGRISCTIDEIPFLVFSKAVFRLEGSFNLPMKSTNVVFLENVFAKDEIRIECANLVAMNVLTSETSDITIDVNSIFALRLQANTPVGHQVNLKERVSYFSIDEDEPEGQISDRTLSLMGAQQKILELIEEGIKKKDLSKIKEGLFQVVAKMYHMKTGKYLSRSQVFELLSKGTTSEKKAGGSDAGDGKVAMTDD
jgi:hypothetical protein